MVDTQVTIQIVKALTTKYESERMIAMAELMVYMRNPTGVGGHATLLDTMDTLIERVACADSKMSVVNSYFTLEVVPEPEGHEQ